MIEERCILWRFYWFFYEMRFKECGGKMEDIVRAVAEKVGAKGGRAFFVGGFVRDKMLGLANSDVDIECFGVEYDELFEILSAFGTVFTVGKAFGILKLAGYPDIDFALPRREKKIGDKHVDFVISIDPSLSYVDAARRRDFTCNALMEDVLTGEILDFFGGLDDIEQRVLRHIADETFVEDALRGLRACQFASRFDFTIALETAGLIRTLDYTQLSHERIYGEIAKGLFRGKRPSVFISYMIELGVFEQLVPEFGDLIEDDGVAFSDVLARLDVFVQSGDYLESEVLAMLCQNFPEPRIVLKKMTNNIGLVKSSLVLIEALACVPRVERLSDCRRIKFMVADVDRFLRIVECLSDWVLPCDFRNFEAFHDFFMGAIIHNPSSTAFIQGRELIEIGLMPSEEFGLILAVAKRLEIAGCLKEEILQLLRQKYLARTF